MSIHERTLRYEEEPAPLLIDEETQLKAIISPPTHAVTLYLPTYQYRQLHVRDTVHTDTIRSTLYRLLLHTPAELYMKGRILTYEQRQQLLKDPLYNFYLNQRAVRTQDIEQKGLQATFSELPELPKIHPRRLLTFPYGVEGLAARIGYKLGYYNVKELYDLVGDPLSYKITPLFAGSNRITLGSNTFSLGELNRVTTDLKRHIRRL